MVEEWTPYHPRSSSHLTPNPFRFPFITGNLLSYQVIVRGFDAYNISKLLTNMTVDASTPSLMLANLTSGVTYSVSVAAATKIGTGAFSQPAILRLDPNTRKLDQGFTRYPINHNLADDIITQTWFIVLLGSIIAVIVFLFGAMVLFRRIQYIKQSSLSNIHGKCICITVSVIRAFPHLILFRPPSLPFILLFLLKEKIGWRETRIAE